jgi:hypothetical protein
MSNDFRKQVYDTLNLKETDELAEIWQVNDRVEWSDITFEVIQEILQQRLGELPTQNKPIHEHVKQDTGDNYDNSPLAKFADKENTPEFYKPQEVLWMYTWLERASKAAVIITVIINLPSLSTIQSILLSYLRSNPELIWLSWLIAIFIGGLAIAVQCFIVLFSLKALASILKILMEMEFNSRGVK